MLDISTTVFDFVCTQSTRQPEIVNVNEQDLIVLILWSKDTYQCFPKDTLFLLHL